MSRDTRTAAEKLRAHREAFELALQLRITPREAQDIINERAQVAAQAHQTARARERHEASSRSLAAKMNTRLPRPLVDPEPPPPPYWLRD